MSRTRTLVASLVILFGMTCTATGQWKKLDPGTDASFRGLDVVSEKVIWASGTGGTVIRSIDGGKSWSVFKVEGAEKLDFRDIEAFSERTAYVLSIGNGKDSRIYKTVDGGESWKLQFENTDKNAFFDSLAFWDEKHGTAQSDPVNGRYVIYATTDGETWSKLPSEKMPAAKEGEAAFAASGTCIVTHGNQGLLLITGGMDARVLYSADRGETWRSSDTPLIKGEGATGIFGIAVLGKRGVIVGGDYTKPAMNSSNIAYSLDGGKTWSSKREINSFGYRSGVTFVDEDTLVIVGSGGSDISTDFGNTWNRIDDGNWNAVDSKGRNAVFAVGPAGAVGKYSFPAAK